MKNKSVDSCCPTMSWWILGEDSAISKNYSICDSITCAVFCRIIKPGGLACLIGPVHPTFWLSRIFADAWMLFPTEDEYTEVNTKCPHKPCCSCSNLNFVFKYETKLSFYLDWMSCPLQMFYTVHIEREHCLSPYNLRRSHLHGSHNLQPVLKFEFKLEIKFEFFKA